jgi:Integrase zinc binding domain
MLGDEADRQALLKVYHDAPLAGHPGAAKMLKALVHDYWWLSICSFMQNYIKGCLSCQARKAMTHPNKPPLQLITLAPTARPFLTIAMDFTVKLPLLNRYDLILTITDHNGTKAVILLPCNKDMDALGVAKLYLKNVFPYVGIPMKVISDQDPRFTSRLFREVCELLKIKQNVLSAYHPQTDGQSEKTNQHIKTTL